ncbi:hypothetical protein [Paenibacillus sp. LHD-38]|uniref:hypothetical protein n=1 Tax=Paenibacillus sp. LHD-38 TaxID=3072143 RepID=UPI00280E81EC|nr:hypothetical protein [Paenibacillus sp. LHD-38]MDQ8734829.1 hypothetical protein [Paenibacillus sp. LHD-38]
MSQNLYTYVHNNPLRYTDPSGHQPRDQLCNGMSNSECKTARSAWYDLADVLENQYSGASYRTDANVTVKSAIIDHKSDINSAGEKWGVPPELILAIIVKEQYTKSIPDWVAMLDSKIRGGTHSVGLGAIFPSTARTAWSAVSPNTVLPKSNKGLQSKLKDDAFNIETIAVILVYQAQQMYGNDVDPSSLTMDQWKEVVPYYNASMSTPESRKKGNDYASKVFEYLPYTKILLR